MKDSVYLRRKREDANKSTAQRGFYRFNLNSKYEVTLYVSQPAKLTYQLLLKQLQSHQIIQIKEEGPLIFGQKLVINDKEGKKIEEESIGFTKNIVNLHQRPNTPARKSSNKVIRRVQAKQSQDDQKQSPQQNKFSSVEFLRHSNRMKFQQKQSHKIMLSTTRNSQGKKMSSIRLKTLLFSAQKKNDSHSQRSNQQKEKRLMPSIHLNVSKRLKPNNLFQLSVEIL